MPISITYNGVVSISKKFGENIKPLIVTNNGTENLFKYLCWHLVGSNTSSVDNLRPYYIDIKVIGEEDGKITSVEDALYSKVSINGIQAYKYSALANNSIEIPSLTGKYITEFNCAILGSNIAQKRIETSTHYYRIEIYGQDKDSLLAYAKLMTNDNNVLNNLSTPDNGELLIQWFMHFDNYSEEIDSNLNNSQGGNE